MVGSFVLQHKDAKGEEYMSEDVFNIFSDYLKLETSTPVAEAAKAVSKLPPSPDDNNTIGEGFFWKLWKDIIAIAEQIPHDHLAMDKLVRFMRELTLLPDTGIQVWGTRVWTDLPILGAEIREHLNGPAASSNEEEQAAIDRKWVSFHAFAARLIGAGVTNYVNNAIWMLRDALEEKSDGKSPKALDRDLVTASMYIEYAGPILVESIVRTPSPTLSKEADRVLRGGPLYEGKSGLRSDRWLFWMKRFKEEAEKASTGEAKSIALRAARLMEIWVEKRLQPKD